MLPRFQFFPFKKTVRCVWKDSFSLNVYIKTPSRLSKKKKKMQTQKPKLYFPIEIQTHPYFQFHLFAATPDQNNVFQTNNLTRKENPKGRGKIKEEKLENLCSLSATVKLKIFVHPLQQQAIQKQSRSFSSTTDNSEGRHFSPFFCFLFNYRFQGFQKYMGLVEGRHIFPPFFFPFNYRFKQIDR